MPATKQFIEDAVEGGHSLALTVLIFFPTAEALDVFPAKVPELLLDLCTWQAVGRTRGWGKRQGGLEMSVRVEMRSFIDHLSDGLSIEDALTKIQ